VSIFVGMKCCGFPKEMHLCCHISIADLEELLKVLLILKFKVQLTYKIHTNLCTLKYNDFTVIFKAVTIRYCSFICHIN